MFKDPIQRPPRARRKRLRVTPRFWAIVALVCFVYIATSYALGFLAIWRLKGEIRQVQAEIAVAEARNEELRRELEYLQSDDYIEKVAREELGLVKPGETPVVFTTEDPPAAGGHIGGGVETTGP